VYQVRSGGQIYHNKIQVTISVSYSPLARLTTTMSNLKAYLAEKYMSGPKADAILAKTAPQKKKKRKAKELTQAVGGVVIRDDDGGWGDAKREEEEDEDLAEAVVEKDRGFKKRKVAGSATESNWITIDEGVGGMQVKEESPPPAADEQPVVVDTIVGGLMNPKELKRVLPQNNVVDAMSNLTEEEIALAHETVYRDSSGKVIDTRAAKAEAARLKREREKRDAKKMEWGKGLVQRDEAEKRRQELEKHKTTTFARHADDKELNEELKARELWNDPAARFLTVRPLSLYLQLTYTHFLSEK